MRSWAAPSEALECETLRTYLVDPSEGGNLDQLLNEVWKINYLEKMGLKSLKSIPQLTGVSEALSDLYFELSFFSERRATLTKAQKRTSKASFEECFLAAAKSSDSLMSFEALKSSCLLEGVKAIIPESYSKTLLKELDEYVWSEDQKLGADKYIQRLIKHRISKAKSLASINEQLDLEIPTILAKLAGGVIDNILKSNFTDEENYLFNSKARSKLSKKLFYLISGNSKKPLSYELKKFVFKEYNKVGAIGTRFKINSIIKIFVKEATPFISVKEAGDEIFNIDERELIAGIVDEETQVCLDAYLPEGESSFKEVYKYCEKKRLGLLSFLLAKRDFEKEVSHSFTLASEAGNNALSPVHYMQGCIENLDKKNLNVDSYERYVQACINLTRIKISYNIDLEKVKKFRPFIRGAHRKSEHKLEPTPGPCHSSVIYKINKNILDGKPKEIESFLMSGDLIYNEQLLSTLAESEKLNGKWFEESLKQCRDGTHRSLMSGLKKYLIHLIPASKYAGKNRVGETNKEVLESFLDVEVLELLLQLKIKKAGNGGAFNSSEKDPRQKIVTSTLSLNALSNFIEILGKYVTDGLIYEKNKMKTELVIFREELKRALKWIINQDRPIRIAELGDFFSESNLADHMAQAMVSELVRSNFMKFLKNMEQNELRSERQSSGKGASLIKAKFVKLRAHTKRMTNYYDFKHIIRPKSNKGDRLLKMIKENYLLPKVIGAQVSSYTMEKISLDVSKMILGDNTEGGFAELFVKEMAQFELGKKKESHWGITRFLFYDTGDFDWEVLRETKSGKLVIDYYGREVLLPLMLGRKQSKYTKKLNMDRFREMLLDAIVEND